jgi:hypothetical protein
MPEDLTARSVVGQGVSETTALSPQVLSLGECFFVTLQT